MNFANPLFLWALSALLIPLAIHLWSQKKVKTIKVGSIRFIAEQQPRKTHSLHPNEWWLLILRMLVLALLVLILADPKLDAKPSNDPITYVIEHSLLKNNMIRAMIDSLPQGSVRMLRSGFPEITESESAVDEAPPSYWQLAQQLEKLPSDSVIVFAKARYTGIKGRRPAVKGNIHWVVMDPGNQVRTAVRAVQSDDSVQVLYAESNSGYLTYFSKWIPAKSEDFTINETEDSLELLAESPQQKVPFSQTKPTKILLGYHNNFLAEKEYISAAIRAVARYLNRKIDLQVLRDSEIEKVASDRFLIWLSPQPPPQTTKGLLTFQPDSLADRLILPGKEAGQFHLTDFLNAESITEEHLPEQIMYMLGVNSESDGEAKPYDLRAMDMREFRPYKLAGIGIPQHGTTQVTLGLWLLLGTLLITERVLAYVRKQ